VFAFILESLGATEVLFILAIALIFFGPRKLPQLARSMGKGLAEFRKASDDFKRTWEREVALETGDDRAALHATGMPTAENTAENADIADPELANAESEDATVTTDPQLEPANPEWVVARDDSPYAAAATTDASIESAPEPIPVPAETTQPEPLRKHDWV
jgi:TatA/E family protein of Tat protein translocase